MAVLCRRKHRGGPEIRSPGDPLDFPVDAGDGAVDFMDENFFR